MTLCISTPEDLTSHLRSIEDATRCAIQKICNFPTPTEAFYGIKFDKIGRHPVDGYELNLVEQINQTFTYLVALKAAAWLLNQHPEAHAFKLAPGAKAELPYDIVSVEPDFVCAETFAVVHTTNNRKLTADLKKLRSAASYQFRYLFFFSPGFQAGRHEKLEPGPGIEVHCVEFG